RAGAAGRQDRRASGPSGDRPRELYARLRLRRPRRPGLAEPLPHPVGVAGRGPGRAGTPDRPDAPAEGPYGPHRPSAGRRSPLRRRPDLRRPGRAPVDAACRETDLPPSRGWGPDRRGAAARGFRDAEAGGGPVGTFAAGPRYFTRPSGVLP